MDGLDERLQATLGAEYVVEGRLGAGGYAVVFRVHDLGLKRRLAVKVVRPEMFASQTTLQRFRREAETIAQLAHPNIVPLHFIGQKDDFVFLAMGLVDGGSLAERLARDGPLPPGDVRRVMIDVALALEHAHRRGVIHRDIKPQNVLVDSETQRVLVTDFGLARSGEGEGLTGSGVVLGTPAYLAPEQLLGDPVDHRADVFALGVMAYELLTGRRPFEGKNTEAALLKRLSSQPAPPARLRSGVPRQLSDVILRCLARSPAERFQSAGDVARALGHGRASRVSASWLLQRTPRRARWLMSAAGALIVLSVIGFAAFRRAHVAPPAARPAKSSAGDTSMIVVPAGSYTIGSDTGPPLSRPAHAVSLSAFALGRTEVTVAEYARFTRATGRALAPGQVPGDSSVPVTGVTWRDASDFCAWRYPQQGGGRLPTEEEWEAAARGASARAYPWGDQFDSSAANLGSSRDDRSRQIIAVGSYPRGHSSLGFVDMIGNVWEWTSSTPRAYGAAAPTPDDARRVIRGGAFNTRVDMAAAWVRVAYPMDATPQQLANTGFRCAMSAVDGVVR
jgi:formylglycine-generating enzyme required for sulfatase activity/tRNA A-37 threonylcarbamoyl transferase component Bud32